MRMLQETKVREDGRKEGGDESGGETVHCASIDSITANESLLVLQQELQLH